MKHNLSISISKKSRNGIVSCRTISVRQRLMDKLFGRPQKLTILVPGDSVDEVSITEVPEKRASPAPQDDVNTNKKK